MPRLIHAKTGTMARARAFALGSKPPGAATGKNLDLVGRILVRHQDASAQW